jgi:hypothetical protein
VIKTLIIPGLGDFKECFIGLSFGSSLMNFLKAEFPPEPKDGFDVCSADPFSSLLGDLIDGSYFVAVPSWF